MILLNPNQILTQWLCSILYNFISTSLLQIHTSSNNFYRAVIVIQNNKKTSLGFKCKIRNAKSISKIFFHF